MSTTTKDHAERAFRCLKHQDYLDDNDAATAVRDLLADLRHYCDEQGVDFDHENRVARDNYLAEIE